MAGVSTYDVSKSTGLFGGTFDPIHCGHLQIAEYLIRRKIVEQVLFVPAFRPPHKRTVPISAAEMRMAMLRIAIAHKPGLFMSDFETSHQRVVYTVETARHFSTHLEAPVSIIIGTDSLAELSTWHQAVELVNEFEFIIYDRPDSKQVDETALRNYFGALAADKLLGSVIEGTTFPISGTQVRNAIRNGKATDDLVPPGVREYIDSNGLYRQEE